MVSPGAEGLSMFLRVSRALDAVGRGKVPLPMEVRDAVEDDPLIVDEPVLVVGDVPREFTGGVCVGPTPNNRRGLLCGLSFGLGSLSEITAAEEETLMPC
jgi:hypothetical protein